MRCRWGKMSALGLSETFISSDKQQWGAWFIKGWGPCGAWVTSKRPKRPFSAVWSWERRIPTSTMSSQFVPLSWVTAISKSTSRLPLNSKITLNSSAPRFYPYATENLIVPMNLWMGLAIDPNDPAIQYLKGACAMKVRSIRATAKGDQSPR